jgi:hypothetical protein
VSVRLSMDFVRHHFRRVNAPMVHRPVSWDRFSIGSLGPDDLDGGLRTYSDESMRVGDVLEVDVLLPDGGTAAAVVAVAWCDPLPQEHVARYEIGLRLVRALPDDLARMERVLAPGGAAPGALEGERPAR